MLYPLTRVVTAFVVMLFAVTVSLLTTATPVQAAERDPVVFVHGWSGAAWNWNTMIERLEADGWVGDHLYAWDYDWRQSNEVTARNLADLVEEVRSETGAAQVDIVTHSMGGLSSRHYLKFLGGTAEVDDWVSIGGPNHGTSWAYACWTASCPEMRSGSDFLTSLNSGDETPEDADYGTFWSSCDEIINPDDSTVLSGADNHHLDGCYGHLYLLQAWEVYEGVSDFIR